MQPLQVAVGELKLREQQILGRGNAHDPEPGIIQLRGPPERVGPPGVRGTYLVALDGHGDAVELLRIDLLTESGWRIVDRHARKLGGARIVDIVAVQGYKVAYVEVKANGGNDRFMQRTGDSLVVRRATAEYGKPNVDAIHHANHPGRITGAGTFRSIRSVGVNKFAVGFGRLLGLGGNRKVKP